MAGRPSLMSPGARARHRARLHPDIGVALRDLKKSTTFSRRYRHLYKVVKRRHRAGPRVLSQCDCLFITDGWTTGITSDSFRNHHDPTQAWHDASTLPRDNVREFFEELCPRLRERFIIYGTIGYGSFGWVLAARERHPSPGATAKHYALKVEVVLPRFREKQHPRPQTGQYFEVNEHTHDRYIPIEAIVLQHLTQCDRFIKLDSVYSHGDFHTMVMSADALEDQWEEARNNAPESFKTSAHPAFPSYVGVNLTHRKVPQLKNEVQVCKIASHILEALFYLMDMQITHDDLSHRNYLVEKNLDTKLIDLGRVFLARDEIDWLSYYWVHIAAFEYMLSPEITRELNRERTFNRDKMEHETQQSIYYKHDMREEAVWKFGVLVYDLLHGYSPWEDPEYNEMLDEVKNAHTELTPPKLLDMALRRQRIINEELPIHEGLSQDCVDVLRVCLAKSIDDRPTIQRIGSMPWFQGHWVDHSPELFTRPPPIRRRL